MVERSLDQAPHRCRSGPSAPLTGSAGGNFTAAIGVATLDGLGVKGGGAHADDEHIEIESFASRAALLAALILEL